MAVAEDKFVPDFTPEVSVSLSQLDSNGVTTNGRDFEAGATVSVRIPTGGELRFGWTLNDSVLDNDDLINNFDNDTLSQNLELSFNQPLLRGAGEKVNRASIEIARLTEQINLMELKSTLIETITEAVLAYRELLRAQERLRIAQLSVNSAKDLLEFNRVLIEAGRQAAVDIVQSETAVANREVQLLEAQNNLAGRQLALLQLLDIEREIAIVASETPTAEPTSLDANKLKKLALENQPSYTRVQSNLQRTQLALLEAEDNRRWDLSLNTSLRNRSLFGDNNTTDFRAGLVLRREFGDLTIERDFQRSRVNQLQAENSLEEERNRLEIATQDGIRDVNLSFAQWQLAQQATKLSQRQLEIAQEKQRLGRGVTVFELVRLQDDLVQAQNTEVNATINYLNALTRLDQTLGTTLETWQIKFRI
ncbi:MAG: TolC family protein [Symploca sp. SIO3E6]|nr:TolC family protein [Caldora sp. SIO3E6]